MAPVKLGRKKPKTPARRKKHIGDKPLRGRFTGGKPANREATKSAAKRAEMIARQTKVWELYVAGATLKQAGVAVGVSEPTAWHDVRATLARLQELATIDGDLALRRQLARLDAIHRAHYPNRGERASAEILLATNAHEAKLLGLYAQRETGYTVEQVTGMLRGLTALFLEVVQDGEARRRFADGIRRIAGETIDITPERTGS